MRVCVRACMCVCVCVSVCVRARSSVCTLLSLLSVCTLLSLSDIAVSSPRHPQPLLHTVAPHLHWTMPHPDPFPNTEKGGGGGEQMSEMGQATARVVQSGRCCCARGGNNRMECVRACELCACVRE